MKHIKHINELFGVRKLFNKDEETVYGIIDSLTSDVSQEHFDVNGDPFIRMDIDGYSIKIGLIYPRNPNTGHHYSNKEECFGKRYKVWVDDVPIRCSNYVGKKLWTKCKNIKKDTNYDYVRKDAKIHFKNR
jgi:hypothetical protein